jgi:hypothetical protein
MRKIFVVLFLVCSIAVFFQYETEFINSNAIGIGPEWNMDSRKNFAGGVAVGMDYNLTRDFAVGFFFTGSYNFDDFFAIEPVVVMRNYFWENCHGRLFLQAEMGLFIYLEEDKWIPLPEIGLRGGFRKPWGTFYIEPYGRLGYPFAFGIGILAGKLF